MPTQPDFSTAHLKRTLDAFLDAVHREAVELGVREHVEVRRLLQSRERWAPEELRASLAALLARNADELEQIETLFGQHMVDRSARQTTTQRQGPQDAGSTQTGKNAGVGKDTSPTARPPRHDWLRKLIPGSSWLGPLLAFVAIVVTAIALVLAMGLFSPKPPIKPPPLDLPSQGIKCESEECDLVEVEKSRAVTHTAPRRYRQFEPLELLSLLPACVLFFLGIRWWMLPGAVRARRRREIEARLSAVRAARRDAAKANAEKGVAMHLSYHVPGHLPFNQKVLDDAATRLGRVFGQQVSTDLDESGTIRSTLREGGRFVPVYAARRAPRGILVLVDVERGDQPWLAGFSRVLNYLVRQGVPLVCCRFQYSPEWVVPESGGRAIHIHDLSRRYAQSVLLIFSRRLASRSYRTDAAWTSELRNWALAAWIDPDPRPADERGSGHDDGRALEQQGLQRFPWTEEGLLSLAAHLESGGLASSTVWLPQLPKLTEPSVQKAVKKWALCAALVPDATWEQLEAIRRHKDFTDIGTVFHAPWHLQTLLDWTAQQTGQDPESGDGRTLELTPELIERLIRESRKEAGRTQPAETFEGRARRLLLEQLESVRPDDELQHLRWTLKIASHRLILEPAHAYELTAGFFGTAVEEEMRVVLDAELARQGAGLALGGCAVPTASAQRLRAIEGVDEHLTVRALFLDHGRVTFKAAVASVLMGLALGVITVMGQGFDPFRRVTQGLPRVEVLVNLPPTYSLSTLPAPSEAPISSGANDNVAEGTAP